MWIVALVCMAFGACFGVVLGAVLAAAAREDEHKK